MMGVAFDNKDFHLGSQRGAHPLDKLLPPLNFKQKFKLKSQIDQQQL